VALQLSRFSAYRADHGTQVKELVRPERIALYDEATNAPPSHIHQVPRGKTCGYYIAVD
jgi:hypothetical protein